MVEHEVTALTSRIAYENPWLRVREDVVRRADGTSGLYGVVERRDFVIVVPWQDGCLTLVEQYRYPIRRRLWELPMGGCERLPDGSGLVAPAITAAVELREETGLVAESIQKIGSLFQGPGFSDQTGHIFLATGLRQGPTEREVSEQGMICRSVSLGDVEAMIADGLMQDAISLAALGLLRFKGLL